MNLGQSAAAATPIAIGDGVAVQDVNYARFRDRLLAEEQIRELGR